MKSSLSASSVMRWCEKRLPRATFLASRGTGLFLTMSVFVLCLSLAACDSSTSKQATPTPGGKNATVALNTLTWCEKPSMVFRDEGSFTPTPSTTTPTVTGTPAAGPGTPQTITDWSVVKANLGFAVYLPTDLPAGTCLVSAQATIHDPIFGGSFTIGYLLPDHTSLSFSEAPLKAQSMSFECNQTNATTPTTGTVTPSTTPTALPTQLCSGAKNTTNIVLSGTGTAAALQKTFTNLQANVAWIPASKG